MDDKGRYNLDNNQKKDQRYTQDNTNIRNTQDKRPQSTNDMRQNKDMRNVGKDLKNNQNNPTR